MKLLVLVGVLLAVASCSDAYDPLDPTGIVTIQWDVWGFTPDGYVAVVSFNNLQRFRPITSPGWNLSWNWTHNEVVWATTGARTVDQGDCSMFKDYIPSSCINNPTFVDLPEDSPPNWKIANCCRSGVLAALDQDPATSVSQFQISVGHAGTSDKTIKLPKEVKLSAPGSEYQCGATKVEAPTRAYGTQGRVTKAKFTFKVTCWDKTYLLSEEVKKKKLPSCCVSLSSSIAQLDDQSNTNKGIMMPSLSHPICSVEVQWQVELDSKTFWSSKITIISKTNYTQWNLVVEHPDLTSSSVRASNFNYKHLNFVAANTGMFYGKKKYDNEKMFGRVQSELLVMKGNIMSYADNRSDHRDIWAFPRKVYFNGNKCEMPALSSG